ncbi:MAG: MetQ/NlpA family ABC transporter substrate-binding protein [Clostridia bacterium]|nr:MetQ/NlpA family ABC transporter substrate-binding protein [Clostridia bacterium]
MKIRKLFVGLLAAVLVLSSVAALADITIGVPDDTTNEARALQLLADNGIIELAEGADETATKADVIADGIEIVEVQADQLVNQLPDLDYAVINSNFVLDALDAGFEINTALLTEVEEKYLPRANVIAVNGANVDADLTKALVAAATSQQVKDYIEATYAGAVLSVVDEPTDGYDPDVDYDALAGTTLVIAATPAPHAQILEIVKQILAEKDINLDVAVFTGYTEENPAVDAGDAYANYFQHQPYLDEYVAETGGNVVSVAVVHTEPMGLYGGKQADLSALGK